MNITRLKDLREDNDLEQVEVAKILGISQQYYSRYELGQVDLPIRHYITLARFYNVSIDYLAGLSLTYKPLEPETTKKGLTEKQLALLRAYEKHPEMQIPVDKLLDI